MIYELELLPIFALDPPLRSVIRREIFGNYFSFSRVCTIGNNKGRYPVIGEKVEMFANSKIIGNSHIGNKVIIAANTYVKDQNIDSIQIVFGESPNLIFKTNRNV